MSTPEQDREYYHEERMRPQVRSDGKVGIEGG